MFQNAYQSGSHVEIYDAKVNKEKEKSYAQLYRMTTPQGFSKIFDKDIKGYIKTIDGHSTKMRFPKDDRVDLCIVQHFLVLQIYLPFGSPWSLEIGIADTQKVNRRINLVSALNKIETKYFHVKAPNDIIKRGVWMNLSIDVNSFMEAWKGQTFRSIDSITIGSACKLRRVYSMKAPIFEMNSDDDIEEQMYLQQSNYVHQKLEEPPRNFSFPPGFPYINQLITYGKILDNVDPKYLESSVGHGDSIDTVKFGNGTSQAKTIGGSKSTIHGGVMKRAKQTKQSNPQVTVLKVEHNITEDFQEKSMIGFKLRDSSQNSFQKNTTDRSLLSKNPTKLQRESSSQQNRNNIEEPDRQENSTALKNKSRNTSKNHGSGIQGQGVLKIVPKSPNSTFNRSPNIQQNQPGKQTLDRNGKGTLKAGGTLQKSSQNSKSNPWYASTNSTGSSRRKLFDEPEGGDKRVEEIEENLEGEYYDKYDELPTNPVPKKVNQTVSQGHQQQMNSSTQQKAYKQTNSELPIQEQQKRAIKSANIFGAKQQSLISSQNQPDKIKKKPEKKYDSDQFAQSMNTTDLNEESYFQLTQKFNTVSDPNQFRDIFAPQGQQSNNAKQQLRQQSSQSQDNSREIEEDIEVDQYNSSPQVNKAKKVQLDSRKKQQKSPGPVRNFEDSLERPYPTQNLSQKNQKESFVAQKNESYDDNDDYLNELRTKDHYHSESQSKGVTPNYNIYENHLNKFITSQNRPFTPPFQSVIPLTGNSIITKKNNSTVVIQTQQRGSANHADFNENYNASLSSQNHKKTSKDTDPGQIKSSVPQQREEESDQLEVIYDPVLNCYYDPATKQYYELKS